MANYNVNEVIKEIKDGLSQTSSSAKDEVKIMQTMLNDKDYEVGVYGASGKKGTYNPAMDYREMQAGVIAATVKISKDEAKALADAHEVTKGEATTLVNVSKEFVNTYLHTGRKLPFGGRENSNLALCGKDVEQTTKSYPKKIGVNEDGTGRYESGEKVVPAHFSAKVYGSCPAWVK